MKNSNDTSWNQTSDLPIFSTASMDNYWYDTRFLRASPAKRILFDLISNIYIAFISQSYIFHIFRIHVRKAYSVAGKILCLPNFVENTTLLLPTIAHVQIYLRPTSWRHIPIFPTVRLPRGAVVCRTTQITFPSSLIINTHNVSSAWEINDYGSVGTALQLTFIWTHRRECLSSYQHLQKTKECSNSWCVSLSWS